MNCREGPCSPCNLGGRAAAGFHNAAFCTSTWSRGLLAAACICCGLTTPGCTIVERQNTDGSFERSLSLLRPITVVDLSGSVTNSVRAAGLGIGITAGVFQLGLFRMSTVRLDSACRVVIVPDSDAQLQNFEQFLKENPDLCGESSKKGQINAIAH